MQRLLPTGSPEVHRGLRPAPPLLTVVDDGITITGRSGLGVVSPKHLGLRSPRSARGRFLMIRHPTLLRK